MMENDSIPNRRILIIDDNQAIHDDFRKILAPADAERSAALDASEAELFGEPVTTSGKVTFELDSAYQGQEGLEKVREAMEAGRPYAMAFVDVRMPPGWDGVETTGRLLEVDPHLQIVICTAYADYSWDDIFAKVGDRDGLVILKKPFDTVEALQLAYAFTEKWRLHREARAKMEDLEARVAERTAELRASEKRFLGAFEYAAAGMALVGIDGRWIKVNRALCEMFGYPAEELCRIPWDRFVDEAHRDSDADDRRRLLDGKVEYYQVQIRCLNRKGNALWVLLSVSLVRDESGNPLHFVWQVQDITKRKRAEQQLSLEYAVSRVLAESFGQDEVAPKILEVLCAEFDWDAGVLWRPSHRSDCLQCSALWKRDGMDLDAFAEQVSECRFSRDEGLPGRAWATGDTIWAEDFSIEEQSDRAEAAARVSLRSVFIVPVLMENRVVGVIELFSAKRRACDEDLRRIFVVLGSQLGQFFQRRNLEEKLFQTEKLKTVGKLAGGVAHEFNSILTAIIGRSEMVLGDLTEGSATYSNTLEIRKAADRAAVLTRQLLAYGRKQMLRVAKLDLNRVIQGMDNMLGHLMGSHVDVRINAGDDLGTVEADAGQMEEVVVNLAMNAADAMPDGGKLTLETANVTLDSGMIGRDAELNPGSYVMLAVSDTGTGMSPEVRERVFEPFFTTKEVGKGSGLGLATCYGIVKQIGGHITVYSEPGRGTTFKIYLPRRPEESGLTTVESSGTPATSDLPRGTERILVVEDDPGLRDMATALLQRLGYSVVSAENGTVALELAKGEGQDAIDLLFTDVVMPEMDGLVLCEKVQTLHPGMRILFTSAYTENAVTHQGLMQRGMELLEKPFTPRALARKVREVLDRAPPGRLAAAGN